jgi:hypothetical protein
MQVTLTIRQEAVPIVKSSLETRRKSLEFGLRRYQARLALNNSTRWPLRSSRQSSARANWATVRPGLSGSSC